MIFAENETRNENAKYSFVRNRKWPKPSNLVIVGAEPENENEFRSVSILIIDFYLQRVRIAHNADRCTS